MSAEASSNIIQPLKVVEAETLGQLTNGVLGILQPEMIRVQESLEELTYVLNTTKAMSLYPSLYPSPLFHVSLAFLSLLATIKKQCWLQSKKNEDSLKMAAGQMR